jgi:hypothetical protein
MEDLLEALDWEYTNYLFNGHFDPSTATAKTHVPFLDWGGNLQLVVGDAINSNDQLVVCLAETSPSGTTFAVGQVEAGTSLGTYYSRPQACPTTPSPANIAVMSNGWFDAQSATGPPGQRLDDFETMNDLVQAMGWEDSKYATSGQFDGSLSDATNDLPALDWGGRLQLAVGDVLTGDQRVFCISEVSPSGSTFKLAQVNSGPDVGTYYGSTACPARISPVAVTFGTRW